MKKLITLLYFLSIGSAAFPQSRIYVDQTAVGAANGQSWADAYTGLQAALFAADAGDTVWVAEGIYYPTATADRAISFEPRSGVCVFGGFSGSETALAQRNWPAHPTILSGDIGLADDSTDNSYNVMYLLQPDSFTVIDGLVLRDGVADNSAGADSPDHRFVCGGGLYVMGEAWEAYPEIRNCRFEHNTALISGGGAMINGTSNGSVAPRIFNCTFHANRAGDHGGGLCKNGASQVERGFDLDACIFTRNRAGLRGGGFLYFDYNGADSIGIRHCTFEKNEAALAGGGIFSFLGRDGKSHFHLQKTIFDGNFSKIGVALDLLSNFSDFDGEIVLDSCVFKDHKTISPEATIIYADLLSSAQSGVKILGNVFERNHAYNTIAMNFQEGAGTCLIEGAIFKDNVNAVSILRFLDFGEQIVKNSIFLNNVQNATVTTVNISKVEYFNCIFRDTILNGASFVLAQVDTVNIENCVLYDAFHPKLTENTSGDVFVRNCYIRNATGNFFLNPYCKTHIANCYITGFACEFSNPNVICEGGILKGNTPMFTDVMQNDFRLLPCSPLINSGNNSFLTTGNDSDAAGNPRIRGGTVDIGALEAPAPVLAADPVVGPACPGIANGSVSFSVENGCEPYLVAWSLGGQNGQDLDSLQAGVYDLTVTDMQGSGFVTTVIVPGSSSLVLTPISTPVMCGDTVGGSAGAIPGGGTPPFSYQWPIGADPVLTNLAPGNYPLTVTDARGCTATDSVTVGRTGSLNIGIQATEISCFGAADGGFTVIPLNGKAPFTWNWANGPAGPTYAPIGPGTYQGTLTDAFGCSILWILPFSQPDSLQLEATVTPASDSINGNGSIQLGPVSGGTQPYSAFWSNGQSGFVIDALPPGAYTVTLIDGNGCGTVATYVVPFTTSIQRIAEAPAIFLFPNPADRLVRVRSGNVGESCLLRVCNALGQAVWERRSAGANLDVDCGAWPAGVYYLSLQTERESGFTAKFIVRH